MALLLAAALLAATPTAPTPPAAPAMDQLKRLEGNWRTPEGQLLSYRVLPGGAVVEQLSEGGRTLCVAVYRVQGTALVAAVDGETHAALTLTQASPGSLRFEGPGGPLVLRLGTPEVLRRELKGVGAEFTREFVDTLK